MELFGYSGHAWSPLPGSTPTLDGRIAFWNAAATRLYGHGADEAGLLRRIGRGERIEHYEPRRLTRDGRLLDVDVTLWPIRPRERSRCARPGTFPCRASRRTRGPARCRCPPGCRWAWAECRTSRSAFPDAPLDVAGSEPAGEPASVPAGRRLVRGALRRWGLEALADTALLVTSELLANAVRHATGPVGLRVWHSRSLGT
ncbi:hypothetical protein [Streptomyces sp. ODS28]|uniref:hypothetical protein n=1 Tax=Streptomyces sp. ODS28 TaxID=3136688 RepID=UPI0031E866D5